MMWYVVSDDLMMWDVSCLGLFSLLSLPAATPAADLPSAFCCHAAAALQCCYITPSSSSAAAVARELKSYRGTGATPLVAPCCFLLTSFCSCCCCRLLSRDLRFPLMSAPPDRVSAGWSTSIALSTTPYVWLCFS